MENQYLTSCSFCGNQFQTSRIDTKYCSNRCRKGASRQQQTEVAATHQERSKIDRLILRNLRHEDEITALHKSLSVQVRSLDLEIAGLRWLLSLYSHYITLPSHEYFNELCHEGMYYFIAHPELLVSGTIEGLRIKDLADYEGAGYIEKYEQHLNEELKPRRNKVNKALGALLILRLLYERNRNGMSKEEAVLRDQIRRNEEEIELLEAIEREQQEQAAKQFEEQAPKALQRKSLLMSRKKRGPEADEYGAEELLNMNFDTFMFSRDLGEFLGELDRNMLAFALTGDSNGGKSYFSFELAKLFIDHNLSAKYFSLEEGLGKLTQKKIQHYEIDDRLKLAGKGGLVEVREAAKRFDCVLVDSYSKLSNKPEDFEALRQDFPKTIFVIIFQKTTSGSIRGGSSIKFNSPSVINVSMVNEERLATMEKSRYGTAGWIYHTEEMRLFKTL